MRKTLLSGLFFFASIASVFANAGFVNSHLITSTGGGNIYTQAAGTSALGTYNGTTGTLLIKGGQSILFKDNSSGNICSAVMNYRIYPAAAPAGGYTALNLPFSSESTNGFGGKDQVWENNSQSIDLLVGKINGNYTIEIYYSATGSTSNTSSCSDNLFLSNGGNNYKFNYTITNSPLPVSLTKFTGEAVQTAIQLNWETVSETNNDFFSVQRSSDLKAWEAIGSVKGAGSIDAKQVYTYTDKQPIIGTNYYRLKQVDFNGNYEYGKAIAVKMIANAGLVVYPNPAKNSINIVGIEHATTLQLIDLSGNVLHESSISENTTLALPNVSGMYLIRVSDGSTSNSKRIVIDK